MKKIVLIVMSIVFMLSGCSYQDIPSSSSELESSVDSKSSEISSSEESKEDKYGLKCKYYEPGTYKVGTDLPAGEYLVLCISQIPGYFGVYADANKSDIIHNNNFEVNSYVTVEDGDYFEASRSLIISVEEFNKYYHIVSRESGAMLKVGIDIEPGEYKLICEDGEDGYYSILSDSRQGDIIANDIFENSTYVSISNGQYLELSRCHIEE